MHLRDRYRELRNKLFLMTVFQRPRDGEWESQEHEDARELLNKNRKEAWDAETENHISEE